MRREVDDRVNTQVLRCYEREGSDALRIKKERKVRTAQ